MQRISEKSFKEECLYAIKYGTGLMARTVDNAAPWLRVPGAEACISDVETGYRTAIDEFSVVLDDNSRGYQLAPATLLISAYAKVAAKLNMRDAVASHRLTKDMNSTLVKQQGSQTDCLFRRAMVAAMAALDNGVDRWDAQASTVALKHNVKPPDDHAGRQRSRERSPDGRRALRGGDMGRQKPDPRGRKLGEQIARELDVRTSNVCFSFAATGRKCAGGCGFDPCAGSGTMAEKYDRARRKVLDLNRGG